MEKYLEKRWDTKRKSIYNMRDNINRLKRSIYKDIYSDNEKNQLTDLIIRIMFNTSERVGNESSAKNGHYGICYITKSHVIPQKDRIRLKYIAKSGVQQNKIIRDPISINLIKKLLKRDNHYIFTTTDGFHINEARINRYLKKFGVKSKDIRGFNANMLMIGELVRIGKVKEQKQRPKVFNDALRKIGANIGHTPATLRKHYLLPEIEENFYAYGSVGRVKMS
jgi:DNA topoisomerase-1